MQLDALVDGELTTFHQRCSATLTECGWRGGSPELAVEPGPGGGGGGGH